MAIIKSFTSLEQSKKLAEILPLESADWTILNCFNEFGKKDGSNIRVVKEVNTLNDSVEKIPCWSLAALLGVLPMITEGKDTANPFIAKTPDNEYYVVYATLTKEVDSSGIYDNPIDACYDMIINLKKLNLL